MQDQQQTIRQLFQQAKQKFNTGDFNTAKSKLQQINEDDKSIQLNKLLCQFQTSPIENCQGILQALLKMLTETNIDLYKKNCPNEIHFINHEMLYYNIVAIAQYLGKTNLSQLVGQEALFFYKCLQTNTSLMLIYQNLKRSLNQNRFSTCMQLIEKFQKIIEHSRNLNNQEEKFRTMINILFTSALLKLHMVDQSQALFMLKFEEEENEKFVNEERNTRTRRKNKLVYKDLLAYLKAEIDFANKNYEKSIHGMLGFLSSQSNREKIYAQNNIAINLCASGKPIAAQKIFVSNCETLHKALGTNKKAGTQLPELFQKTKQNTILAYLYARQDLNSQTHFNIDSDQKCYNQMKTTEDLFSFKQQYRRGQCCLNLYHSSLEKFSRKLPWQEIHDNYDNVYYFPNQPYYQFKGRNKNVHLANKKPVYRRYVLNQWNDNPNQNQADKDVNRKKFEKQANTLKFTEELLKAEESFKKALILLEKQEALAVRFEGAEADMTKIINEKLYHEYSKFKSSIFCLLAYTSLCLCKWHEVIKYAEEFTDKRCGQVSPQNNYAVLTYQLQAYCELNRVDQAYRIMHTIVGNGLSKTQSLDCRDGSNLSNCNMEFGMNQELNFIYNMAVLHSRDNRIPQSHQSIQKLFTQMNVLQNYPKAELPLSVLQLLIHYNLRTQNFSAALQLIKRRRILTTVSAIKPILNITK